MGNTSSPSYSSGFPVMGSRDERITFVSHVRPNPQTTCFLCEGAHGAQSALGSIEAKSPHEQEAFARMDVGHSYSRGLSDYQHHGLEFLIQLEYHRDQIYPKMMFVNMTAYMSLMGLRSQICILRLVVYVNRITAGTTYTLVHKLLLPCSRLRALALCTVMVW